MTLKFPPLLFLLGILLSACSGEQSSGNADDDLLLTNAKIWTGNETQPWAGWVAVKNGRTLSVGAEADTPPTAADTRDLAGQLLLPGFNDSHVHFASAGSLLLGINLLDVNDEKAFIECVREATRRLPRGSWITRGDWGAYAAWGMGSAGEEEPADDAVFIPHRSMIDSITTDFPVLVTRYDRAEGLANAAALEFLEMESESGLLTGAELREALDKIPEKSFELRLAESRRALEECRKWGVTMVQDMSDWTQLDVYEHLRAKGELTCRINFSPSRLPEYKEMIARGWTIDWDAEGGPEPAGDEWLAFGTLKTHIDGIMGGRTARFFEPYSDNMPENASWRGGWREFSEEMPEFKRMIIAADNAGIQLRIHAIGDEANAILLDILDTLDQVNGPRDRRFRLVHAQVISPHDFSRFRDRRIVAEVQPYHVTDDMRWMEERIGYERCRGAYAFRTLADNDCILSFGSDWPGTNASYYPVNPIMGLYAAVTRQTVNGEPAEGWFPEQRIDLETALRAYTWGASFSAFEEKIKGTIEPGKLADFAALV